MTKPGIYKKMPFAEYCEIPAINNSILARLISKSPLHAKAMLDGQRIETPALSFGRAVHTAILEPDLFPEQYAFAPKMDRRTKIGKAAWVTFQSDNEDKEILSDSDYETITQMAYSVCNSHAQDYLTGGEAEVTIVWKDEATDLLCKMRCDYVHWNNNIIVDLKTTQDASPSGFSRSMFTYRYHQQVAFYMAGYKAQTGCSCLFTFIPVEKASPYALAVYEAGDLTIEAGENAYKSALLTYKQCVDSGLWPAYQTEIELLDIPEWALKVEGVQL